MLAVMQVNAANHAPTTSANPQADFGKQPTYEEAVAIGEKFIKSGLLDPYSAHIDWPFTFVAFTDKLPLMKRVTGYATCVTVNAKNAYGGYVGEMTYRIVIHDDKVVDYMPVSNLRFVPDICKELSTKYGMTSAPASTR